MNARTIAVLTAVVALTATTAVGGAAGQYAGGDPTAPTVQQEPDRPYALQQDANRSYVVQQGDFCREIEPLSSGETVESFYDYRTHETHPEGADRNYSSYGTTGLQADDASLLFLHEGRNGTSLVAVHDRLGGETAGGVATFDVVGLPEEAAWVVQDDLYDGPSNMDEWDRGPGWASASWIWEDARTDGGAIRGGLDGAFAVTVHPAFNDDAEFADDDDLYDPNFSDGGEITDWVVLSGSDREPDRASLPSLDDPVTIRTGTCEGAVVTYERTDDGVAAVVADAGPDERVVVRPTGGADDGVAFDRLEAGDRSDDVSVRVTARLPESLPDPPDGSLSHLAVTADGEADPADVPATVTFAVERDRVEDPDDLALYEYDRDEDRWLQSPTAAVGETDDAYRFEASVTSLSSVAVAPQQPLAVTDLELDRASIAEGETVEVTATIENPHYAERTHAATLTAFGEAVDERRIVVEPRSNATVAFEQRFTAPGTYTVEIGDERADVVVEPGAGEDGGSDDGGDDRDPMAGFGVLVGAVAVALLVSLSAARATNR